MHSCDIDFWRAFPGQNGGGEKIGLQNGHYLAIFEDSFLDFFTAKLFDKKSKKFHFHI